MPSALFFWSPYAEAETPILWPPDAKNWLIGKDTDAAQDWRQEEKGTRGVDGWMASLIRWTWVWAGSRSWWWTGKPGVLQSMGLQKVGHDWETELNWNSSFHRQFLLRRIEYSGAFQKGSFSSLPAKRREGFLTDIYCGNLTELLR